MGFADSLTSGSGGSSDFVGTGDNSASLYSVSSELAIVPVRMSKDKGVPIPQGGTDPNLTTYSGALGKFGKMDPRLRSQYQQQMWDAGIYGANDTYIPGEFDPDSEKAWAALVDSAAKQELSIGEVLENRKKAVAASGGTDTYYKSQRKTAQGPLVTKVTNPDDLRLTAQEVATKHLGRNFTDAELTNFISAYQGTEQAAQAAVYGAQAGGGNVVAEQSAAGAAETFAKNTHPTEYAATAQVKVFEQIRKMLGGDIGAAQAGTGGGTTGT